LEVARFVKVSQAKVSRLLALARQRGIVRISVADYESRNLKLEQEVSQQHGLRSVAVLKTIEGATAEEVRRTVGHFGAAFVAELLPPASVVAIAGGRTIRELIQAFPEDRERHLTVVQAMGSIDYTVGTVDALEVGRTLARRTGGFLLTLNTPALVADKRTRDSFLGHEQIQGLWRRLKQADVAVVGIGSLDDSAFVERGVFGAAELRDLKARGAVGEICGRFYDKTGRECDSPWRDRVISIDLDQLRRTPQVIGIVAGADRSDAIVAAIRGGLVKSLVVDEAGAQALLQRVTHPRKINPKTSK
jgi:deoxyribonucleoside regulator